MYELQNLSWKLFWGNGPLPKGANALGVIRRGPWDKGALILMPTGIYVQGNAGSLRSLDQKKVAGLMSD